MASNVTFEGMDAVVVDEAVLSGLLVQVAGVGVRYIGVRVVKAVEAVVCWQYRRRIMLEMLLLAA